MGNRVRPQAVVKLFYTLRHLESFRFRRIIAFIDLIATWYPLSIVDPGSAPQNFSVKGSRKKSYFFSGRSTKAYSPSPSALWSKERLQNIKKTLKIVLFPFLTTPHPTSPLFVDCPL